ncbi:MAG: 3-hydroxypropionyl-coenzyme dehydratase [Mycobacterium sp.]|jgi:enoyl-CoA hydratase|uniref:enoyl-CoA hydratase/isomerase family protein n=1 Tax=Mycobacterium sp. TaxID=1785 RepID=UPI0028B3CB1F|nr:3-hydroxypropionyl-coenzyme dehydratase [Mycobacterium sp.]
MTEKSSPSGKLIVGQDGPVTTITLNRPKVHNALDQEISEELNAAIKDVAVDRDCRVLILRGAGNTFCAGDDIKGFLDFAPDDGPWNIRMYQETVNIIDDLVPVTIAGVDGVCAGGGLELTLVCDFVIATHRSRWGMPEINWGITPGWGGTGRLSKFAGRRKTKEWNLLGGLFSAATAERHNLVNRLCEPEDLDREIEMLSEVLLSKDRHATTVTKYFVDKAADLDMWSSMFFEGNPARFGPGENATAGIQAFTQKSTRDERRELIKNFWQD